MLENDSKKLIIELEFEKSSKFTSFCYVIHIQMLRYLSLRFFSSDADTDDEMDSIRIRTLTDQSAAGETYIPDGCIWLGTEDGK